MTPEARDDLEVVTVDKPERSALLPILEESFEGIYLWHARRTLRRIETVRASTMDGGYTGLSMLKMVAADAGYVYYIAVSSPFRGRGLGGRLLDDAIQHFKDLEAELVFASAEEDNSTSVSLFKSRGFVRMDRSFIANRYGRVRSLLMYREMMIVPGEIALRKSLGQYSLGDDLPETAARP